jgi:hypothetical protein
MVAGLAATLLTTAFANLFTPQRAVLYYQRLQAIHYYYGIQTREVHLSTASRANGLSSSRALAR